MAKVAALPETPDAAASSNGAEPSAPLRDPNDPNNQTVVITFRGVTVSIPKRRGRWDIDALVDFQDGKPLPGIRKLIGPQQWGRIKRVGPTGDDLNEFSAAVADAINENCVA
jgi:hypothetical protein